MEPPGVWGSPRPAVRAGWTSPAQPGGSSRAGQFTRLSSGVASPGLPPAHTCCGQPRPVRDVEPRSQQTPDWSPCRLPAGWPVAHPPPGQALPKASPSRERHKWPPGFGDKRSPPQALHCPGDLGFSLENDAVQAAFRETTLLGILADRMARRPHRTGDVPAPEPQGGTSTPVHGGQWAPGWLS